MIKEEVKELLDSIEVSDKSYDFKGSKEDSCTLRWGYWKFAPEDILKKLEEKFVVELDVYEDDDGECEGRIITRYLRSYIITRK